MPNNTLFNISQDYEIIPPKKGKAYPILKSEWEYLKERITKIGDNLNLYNTVGLLLFGYSGSAFINILTNNYPRNEDNTFSTKFIVCLCIAIMTLIIGIISFFFGNQQKKIQTTKTTDVVKQMEMIEERYEDIFSPEE